MNYHKYMSSSYDDLPFSASDDDLEEEINIELTDYMNGSENTQIYTVPYKPSHCNEKRLICYSIINNEACCYGGNCTYSHSLNDQMIDEDRKFIYQVTLDKNLMNFFSLTNPKTEEIYRNLLPLTNLCENCRNKKCTGGFNCRNGVCDFSLKICRNDLLTGGCLNKIIDIPIDSAIVDKLKSDEFVIDDHYQGCLNGHHLTKRGLVPYYKFVHQKENSRRNKYQSIRYIDLAPYNHITKLNGNNGNVYHLETGCGADTESSTDEELNNWFRKVDDEDARE